MTSCFWKESGQEAGRQEENKFAFKDFNITSRTEGQQHRPPTKLGAGGRDALNGISPYF